MNRLPFRTALALPLLALAAVLGLVNPAAAGPTVPYRDRCEGQLTALIPPTAANPLGTIAGTARGVGTHAGLFTNQGMTNFTADGRVLNGRFTDTAADGSTYSGTYSGTFTPIAPNVFRFNLRVLILRGTGRLAGVTGVVDTVAVANLATGRFHFESVGTLTLP